MEIKNTARIIFVPYFGKIGKIKTLTFPPKKIETEATVRILEVEFPDGPPQLFTDKCRDIEA